MLSHDLCLAVSERSLFGHANTVKNGVYTPYKVETPFQHPCKSFNLKSKISILCMHT